MIETQSKIGGIYIHVPFCVKKCAYCDFYSCTALNQIPEYVDALIDEMNMAPDFSFHADTIYFGGGTPSLLEPGQIQRLIDAVCKRFSVASHPEITIEANPGTVNFQKLAGYKKAGANRINIGVQSFSDAALTFLSRIHSSADAICAVETARSAGFDNIGLDLIYGLPGQSKGSWQSDLQAAIRHAPQHLSCYMLTYEPGTQMENNLINGRFRPLPDKAVGYLYELTVGYLDDEGFGQYEVSNFSTSSQTRSRHNQKYWTHAPYLGFGPSAHSFTGKRRFWNVRHLETYLRKTGQGNPPLEETEELTQQQLMMETLYLRLRCADGLSITAFERQFDIEFRQFFSAVIAGYEAEEILEIVDNQCRLTPKGMLFADGVAARVIDLI
jgi:oxygen-independent coproporphyrinogen-3 oxidase